MLGELLTTLNIVEKISKYWRLFRGEKESDPEETIPARFVRLFEAHGVHRNQIPRFIGHGLTLKDVQDDESLLAKLDEPLLEAVCEKFAVCREWLDGVSEQVHPCHDFYKYPEEFERFISNLIAGSASEERIDGILIAPEETGTDALLILQEIIGYVGEKAIYRFYLCNNWRFDYWKSRAYLTACIAIAWKHHIYVRGICLPEEEIEKLEEGETLLGWNGEGLYSFHGWTWYTEDMALKPDSFLNGIDPERNNYGVVSGLELWLDLEKEGLMDTGIRKPPRDEFKHRLEVEKTGG